MKKYVRIVFSHNSWARNQIVEVLDGDDHSLVWHVPDSLMEIDKKKSTPIDSTATYIQITRQFSDYWYGDKLGDVCKVIADQGTTYLVDHNSIPMKLDKDHCAIVYMPTNELVRILKQEPKFEKMMFEPKCKEDSEHIQQKLFELGYKWPGFSRTDMPHTNLLHLDATFLMTNQKGDVMYANELSERNKVDYPKHHVDVVTTHVRTLVKEATTSFNGKEYPTEWLQSLIDNALTTKVS